jgi:hypothetical protein
MNGLRGFFRAKKMADMDLVVKKSYFPTKVGFFSRASIYGW